MSHKEISTMELVCLQYFVTVMMWPVWILEIAGKLLQQNSFFGNNFVYKCNPVTVDGSLVCLLQIKSDRDWALGNETIFENSHLVF